MRGVEVAQGAVGVAVEDGNGGVLTPFAVFATEVVLDVLLPALRRRSLSQPRARAWTRRVGRSAAATTAKSRF